MNEAHFGEIEKVLLYIADARQRAEGAAKKLAKSGGDSHLVAALAEAERSLKEVHRTLMQSSYFAVPERSSTEDAIAP
jgi:hypothetical protein